MKALRISRQIIVVFSGTVGVVLILSVLLLRLILDHDWGAPLNLYVNRELSDAATLILQNRSKEAEQLLINMHPTNPTTSAELHYIRALCLQSEGSFTDSAKEYRSAISESDDENMICRAHIGLLMCQWHSVTVCTFQKTFPFGVIAPALGPRFGQR